MKSEKPKVLHEVLGLPMIHYPVQCASALRCDPIVLVVGHGAGHVIADLRPRFPKLRYALQKEQLGSAHAVLSAASLLKNFKGDLLILSGDVPLLRLETLRALLRRHQSRKQALTLATFITEDPYGYGRVIREKNGSVLRVVEESDLTPDERKIEEVNAGLYVVKASLLWKALKRIPKNPIKKEYYFTELPRVLYEMGETVGAFEVEDETELMGVNTRWELARAQQILQVRLQHQQALNGVTIQAPHRTIIEPQVKIGADTVLGPDTSLLGNTQIGKNCVIEQGSILKDMVLKDSVTIRAYSHLEKSIVETGAIIGPFARIRPESIVQKNAHVGNFTELKKTTLGEGSKANHLSYLGDAKIGKNVNIGAGTITCNYDGVHKYPTILEDGVFVGSDTQLVAPVRVKKNAYIGAGTTVTKEVPAKALAVSRVPQKNILSGRRKKKK